MTAHVRGQRLTEMRDRSAMARAGVTVPNNTDQPPVYASEETLFAEESRATFGGKPVHGSCPDCQGVVVGDAHGLGGTGCVLCGAQITGRWA